MEHLRDMAEDDPENLPAALEKEPPLTLSQSQLLDAFMRLSGHRTVGMAANPITVTDALAFADVAGFDDKMRFLTVIRKCDEVFLQYSLEQQEKNGHREARSKG